MDFKFLEMCVNYGVLGLQLHYYGDCKTLSSDDMPSFFVLQLPFKEAVLGVEDLAIRRIEAIVILCV